MEFADTTNRYAATVSGYVITGLLGVVILMLGGFGAFFWYFIKEQNDTKQLVGVLSKTVDILKDHDDMIMRLLGETPFSRN